MAGGEDSPLPHRGEERTHTWPRARALRTPDFGVPPQWPQVPPHSPRGSGPRPGSVGGVCSGLGWETHPRPSPAPRGEGADLSPEVSRAPSPPPPSGKGSAFGDGGGGGCRKRGAFIPLAACLPLPSGGAGPADMSEAQQPARCRVWDDARRHLHPSSLPRAGGGESVARRGSGFLAVTLIRCRVAACTESGWARASPARVHFLLEKLRAPCHPLHTHTHAHALAARRLSPGGIWGARPPSPGPGDRAGAGRPPGPGRGNPALALRGAAARPASRGLVSICPFRLRVKFAGENPMIRAEPLRGEPPPPL